MQEQNAPSRRPGQTIARVSIYLTIGLAMVMIGLIYFRWAGSEEPTSVLVVQGSAQLNETEVQVRPFGGGVQNRHLRALTLDEHNEFRGTFYLQPGGYTFIARRPLGRSVQHDFEIGNHQSIKVDLLKAFAKAATTMPDTRK